MKTLIWINLLWSILSQIAYLLLSPLFWAVVALIWWQNYRIAKQKSDFFHLPREKVWRKTIQSVLAGLLGGILGSVLMLILGLDVSALGIEYLWILALILALINPRFICFAYSGGILAAVNALFGFFELNAAHLLALIGILHFVEGTLVFIAGHLQAMPIYIKWQDGRIVGGFNMQNFWPLPLIALMSQYGGAGESGLLLMPDWWPLLGGGALAAEQVMYVLVTVLAALGYSDLAVVHSPQAKAKTSAKYLLIYGAVIIALALMTVSEPWWSFLAALAAPLGHELVIFLGKRAEKKGEPLYAQISEGVKILDVLEGYEAQKAGLKSGDIIISVNEQTVHTYRELLMLTEGSNRVQVKRRDQVKNFRLNFNAEKWGLIPVPLSAGGRYLYFAGNFQIPKMLYKKLKSLIDR